MRPSITKDPRATQGISPAVRRGSPTKLRFALGIIYRAKSWTVCSVADAKWSATRNSSVASCYQPSSCLVDDNFHLGSVSSAVKCYGKGSCRCRHRCDITNGTDDARLGRVHAPLVSFWQHPRRVLIDRARSPPTVDKAGRTRDLLTCHGIDCPTITGAGTGTFEFESGSGIYTELQCGSYIFMDADYGRNRDRDGAPTKVRGPRRTNLANHRPRRCLLRQRPERQPRAARRSFFGHPAPAGFDIKTSSILCLDV